MTVSASQKSGGTTPSKLSSSACALPETHMQVKKAHGKTLTKMREGFETNLSELRARCDARLASLEDDLELRRKASTGALDSHRLLPISRVLNLPCEAPSPASYGDSPMPTLKGSHDGAVDVVAERTPRFSLFLQERGCLLVVRPVCFATHTVCKLDPVDFVLFVSVLLSRTRIPVLDSRAVHVLAGWHPLTAQRRRGCSRPVPDEGLLQ